MANNNEAPKWGSKQWEINSAWLDHDYVEEALDRGEILSTVELIEASNIEKQNTVDEMGLDN